GGAVRVLLIDDGSTEAGLAAALKAWALLHDSAPHLSITHWRHEAARGFIGTVNAGFAHLEASGHRGAVILLNSDAYVPEGWLPRLLAPLSDPTVASATPMSNAAEIASAPALCRNTPLAPGHGDAMDAVAAGLGAGAVDAPTGVGFCMALGAAWWQALPRFDTAFGAGYGEEVDWCRRVARRGGRHVIVPGLFVEHAAGASFGSARKEALLRRNSAIISTRYPGYDALVADFIAADPLATPRFALALAWAAAEAKRRGQRPLAIYLCHAMGGGAQMWLQEQIARDCGLAGPGSALTLRVGGAARFELALHAKDGVCGTLALETCEDVAALMARLSQRKVVYSCGVGDRAPWELPELLVALAGPPERKGGPGLSVLFHDYFPLDPDYTLSGKDGVFQGTETDLAAPVAISPLTRRDWRQKWGQAMRAADSLVCFSQASAALVREVYPFAARKIVVRPHRLSHVPRPVRLARQQALTIGVLGNIAPHKGAAVLAGLSGEMARRNAGRLVLLGDLDPGFRLAPPSLVHGPYAREDISSLAEDHAVSLWLIPSTWPETFSYATHEALATGLPVMAFDLGGQGEALEGRSGCCRLDLSLARDPAAILAAARGLVAREAVPARRLVS
ncbi:MAG: glycosyltransferase, partial [Pseudomonadota bacterium]